MNTILTVLIDLLGEVFPVASPSAAWGRSLDRATRRHERLVRWGRRLLGGFIFAVLAALPFLLIRWFGA
ncbi:MAG: hypothetical protein KDN19_12135 [Verrucomicrobiae bacterium]|nr:hypothetical protein [Verrucomicrobiae bacterium]